MVAFARRIPNNLGYWKDANPHTLARAHVNTRTHTHRHTHTQNTWKLKSPENLDRIWNTDRKKKILTVSQRSFSMQNHSGLPRDSSNSSVSLSMRNSIDKFKKWFSPDNWIQTKPCGDWNPDVDGNAISCSVIVLNRSGHINEDFLTWVCVT